jgi:hypothetical protein
MDTNKEDKNSYDEYLKEKKKHSLKSVSTLQIEEAIAKALTELLAWSHKVNVKTILFDDNKVEISLKTEQHYDEQGKDIEI